MKRELVITGVSGFVGRRLAEIALLRGFGVTGLDKIPLDMDGVVFHQVDPLQDPIRELIPKGSVVVHLASLSTDPQCRVNPELALKLNLEVTLKVLSESNAANAERFIFASSEWVYPENQDDSVQTEGDVLDTRDLNSLYALTKLFGESIIRIFASISYTILRFGIVYGPRKVPSSAAESIAFKASQGELITVGSVETARRFIFIDDLVDAILTVVLASEQKISKQIFNVAGPELVSLGRIVEIVRSIVGSNPQIEDQGSKASIRNPDISLFNSIFNWTPAHDFKAGITKCLTVMHNQ